MFSQVFFCPQGEGVCLRGVCLQGGLPPGVCLQGGLPPGGGLPRWVCIQGALPRGSAYREVCIQGRGLPRGFGQTPKVCIQRWGEGGLPLELEKQAARILLECFLVEISECRFKVKPSQSVMIIILRDAGYSCRMCFKRLKFTLIVRYVLRKIITWYRYA